MKPWEQFLLNFIQAAAPTVENLFIHSSRGIAIFNASDNLFNGVVGALSAKNANPVPTPVPTPTPTPIATSATSPA